jgi:glycogen operon protein
VDAVHARGMEVIIDVVYNHTAETDEFGPTLSLRGIDNALYYHLRDDNKALYENWSGCGNCLNLNQPAVLQLVMDSLRYWATEMGVDGFRFDLAPILARRDAGDKGFDPRAPLFVAINQDPICRNKLLIAEPWDIGAGGYQLGGFTPGWLEWNDKYRDTVRRYWLTGEADRAELAHAFAASSQQFKHSHRRPSASVNFITAHDGFTLRDLVSYRERHNETNGEHNCDGHGNNHSVNCGVEGDTQDTAVLLHRRQLQKELLSTLLMSQGTPMLLAGDEIGHSQQGNNNAYCQDNEITWLDWNQADAELTEHVRELVAKRKGISSLTGDRWWEGSEDVRWSDADGRPLNGCDWHDRSERGLQVVWSDGAHWTAEPDEFRS